MARKRRKGTVSYVKSTGKWRGYFEAGYTDTGKRRRLTVSADTRAKCERKLDARIREYENEGLAVMQDPTVRKWLDSWLDEKRLSLRPSAYTSYEVPLRKYFKSVLGKKRLRDLQPDDMRRVWKVMREADLSPTYISDATKYFQQSLKDAEREGHTVSRAVTEMRRPPKGINDRQGIPTADARKLVAFAYTQRGIPESSVQDGSRWLAALLQGMRQGECLGLRWQDVDFDRGIILVRNQLVEYTYADRAKGTFNIPDNLYVEQLQGTYHLAPPKTKTGVRVIPLIGPMRESLLAWRQLAPPNRHNLVWPHGSTQGPESKRHDLKGWKTLQDACGVSKPNGKHYVLHEARNTTANLLRDASVDPSIVTAILGHTNYATSMGYMSVDVDTARGALDAVAGLLSLEA